ncbi:MAG: VOC family protein [Pseudomonadota bacterium]
MTASFVPSHYLCRVRDLRRAVADFEQAGFRVVWGGDPERAHNAMIYFEAGGFIELFDPTASGVTGVVQKLVARVGAALGQPLLVRMQNWLVSHGLCDFALETDQPFAPARDALAASGVVLGKSRDFSRRRADGVTTRWQLCTAASPQLPFLMGPYDPPPVIGADDLAHPNGLRRLLGLRLCTPRPGDYVAELARLVGGPPTTSAAGEERLAVGDFEFQIERGETHAILALLVDAPAPVEAELHGLRLIHASAAG